MRVLTIKQTDAISAFTGPVQLWICAVFLLFAAFLQATPAQALTTKEGITYASGLKLDVHMPGERERMLLFGKRHPVVIYMHGGGWVKGSRKRVYNHPKWLTERGYVFVAIDYRKVPQTNIDGQLRDLTKAISWVKRNIRKYKGDPNRVVIMGHSAGAHLVSLAAARGMVPGVRGVISNDVQAYDLLAYATKRGSIGSMFGTAFSNEPRNWLKWSPATHAKKAGRLPPHMILYSRSQGERRRSISVGYANLLKGRGTRVELFHGTRYSHGAIAARLGRPGDPATAAIERFLARVTR